MINRDLIQTILRRLAALEAEGVSDVYGERFFDLADRETVHRHLRYMREEGLIEAEMLTTGRMNQNIERVYAIRLTNLGYRALQPELKARADDQLKLRNNPWLSGSFFLFATIAIFAVCIIALIVTHSWIVVAVGAIVSVIFLLIIGAFQLRNDDRLSEKSFLDLMGLTLKQLRLIRIPKLRISKNSDGGPEE